MVLQSQDIQIYLFAWGWHNTFPAKIAKTLGHPGLTRHIWVFLYFPFPSSPDSKWSPGSKYPLLGLPQNLPLYFRLNMTACIQVFIIS